MKIRLITIVSILLFIGLLMIYSSSSIWAKYKMGNEYYYLTRQSIFTILGLIIFFISSKIKPTIYYKYANIFFIIPLIMLIIVLFIGVNRGGAKSWIMIGNILIQPSEFMKLGLIIYISKFLSLNDVSKLSNFFIALLILLIVFGIIMLEPDFGSGFVITLSMMILIFIAGANIKYYIYLCLGGMFGIIGLIISAPYRIKRIEAFINPWSDPLGSGFQIIQSLYAITPGGIFGYGYFNSKQKHFFLPEPQTDFIFSIIVEELGLIGGLFVFLLFLSLIITGFKIAFNSKNKFNMYLSSGISIMILIQVFINIAVVIGLIPVTGVTLPFLSYGGSSLIISIMMVGILISIDNENKNEI